MGLAFYLGRWRKSEVHTKIRINKLYGLLGDTCCFNCSGIHSIPVPKRAQFSFFFFWGGGIQGNFKTGFLHVALTVHVAQASPQLTEIHLPLPPNAGIKGVGHHLIVQPFFQCICLSSFVVPKIIPRHLQRLASEAWFSSLSMYRAGITGVHTRLRSLKLFLSLF